MIFLSEKENLIVLNPVNQEVLVRFQNGKCSIDEDDRFKIDLMKSLGYKFEEEIKEDILEVDTKEIKSKSSLKKQKMNAKEVKQ